MLLSVSSTSLSRLRGSIPARGFSRHRYRDRLLSGTDAALLQVRLALVKNSGLYPVIHGHFSLDTNFVDHHLARPHVERHLPGVCRYLLRRGSRDDCKHDIQVLRTVTWIQE